MIFDETLGNSDEIRAAAIIDAAIDICLRGRQVFYFTAQGEEVARWLQRVELLPANIRPQVKVIELAEIRREAELDRLPIPTLLPTPVTDIPSPTEYDDATWVAALRIPAVNPWEPSIGSAHLWHVLPYPQPLYALLIEGISTIGQLHTLQRVNPTRLRDIHPELEGLLPQVQIRTELLRNTVQMWRIGRQRPLPTGVLAEAEMIDVAALPAVNRLQEEANNDGAMLLHRLQTMDDPPIAAKPLEALELWMISEGYIAQGTPMSDADIRARIIQLASPSIRAGLLPVEDVDRLVTMMGSWA